MSEQRSAEWFAERCGRVTASRVADVVARTKSGWGASRANYAAQLIAERMTGTPAESYVNAAMQWGTEQEPLARDAYAFHADTDVAQVGFVAHPRVAWSGASPDGLIGDEGLVEIKCPSTATHLETLLGAPVDDKYLKQMHWQMACTGRSWCDFASFDPRLPEPMRLYVTRVKRDNALVAMLEKEVAAFLDEIAAKVAQLSALYLKADAA